MSNRIKLSETSCEYFINEEKKTVTCKLNYSLKTDRDTEEALVHLINMFPFYTQNATATTHLSDGDTFDVKKGMQAARAKAETMAYKQMKQIIKTLSGKLASMLVSTNDFVHRADDVIKHNNEYRKTF